MEDFDVFTNEIEFTKPFYSNLVNKFINEITVPPNGLNYQRSRKLQAEECLAENDDLACSFHLSEAVSANLRTMAVYRDVQIKSNDDKLYKITSSIKHVIHRIETNSYANKHDPLMGIVSEFPVTDDAEISTMFDKLEIKDEEALHKRYMKFSPENNVDNFLKILKEVPQEWTIVQLTAPYNPNDNIVLVEEYRTEVKSLYITVMANDYLDEEVGPFTVQVPANINKVGEKPLFIELHSLLADNYKTIENAQFLNNKRLIRNYWAKREDIDLRMKSVINVMDKEWLGGWSCLLTGKLLDPTLRDRVRGLVDTTISDWGFIKLTKKQRILLYNLIESCQSLASSQIKSCIRMILCENGNPDDFRQVIDTIDCAECTKEFSVLSDLCAKCLARSFEAIHHFSLVDGLRAFSDAAKQVRENEEWTALKRAKRRPTILIVDEIIDTFPWESLPLLQAHPVTRMENLHFMYHLYKTHEDRIVDGHYTATAEKGRYVIDPDKNLERMERRMSAFVRYWCPHWAGHVRAAPAPEDFLTYLRDADIFLYCGHGDGLQLARCSSGAGVESVRARAAALLAGCGSVRLSALAPHAGAHHHYHISGSPMVVGMLWEVTDLEVDKVVSSLVALFVTSPAPAPWQRVGKRDWSDGRIDTTVVDTSAPAVEAEPDLLSAIAKARRSTNFVMIASSVVARGLPVRIVGEETKS